MHSKLHGIGIDQQGFLEAQQDFQLYRIFQASDSLCVCVGKVKKKTKQTKNRGKKHMDKSSCVRSNLHTMQLPVFQLLCAML